MDETQETSHFTFEFIFKIRHKRIIIEQFKALKRVCFEPLPYKRTIDNWPPNVEHELPQVVRTAQFRAVYFLFCL